MNQKQAKLVAKYLKERYKFIPQGLFLVAIRGYIPGTDGLKRVEEKIDVFDDSITTIFATSKGYKADSFKATIDPGLPWVLKPMSGVIGAGRKEEGHYTYKHGLHKGIPALIQDSKVRARRDVNKDGYWHESEPVQEGFFAMNIHPKLANTKNVGVNSAGCTVIDSMKDQHPWKMFYGYCQAKSKLDYFILNQSTADALFTT